MTATDPFHELGALVAWLDAQESPYVVIDRDYRVVAANPAYRELMGPFGEATTCYRLSHHYDVPCDRAGETCPLQTALRTGTKARTVHRHHTTDGERYVTIELTPLPDQTGTIRWLVERQQPLPIDRHGETRTQLIGQSPAFRRMVELIDRVARANAAVLLQGESGTGKELIAQAIHRMSHRADKPFVAVDCSGIPETLFESELFGHEKGAFTGATQRKIGLVEAADGGTLFLDELGDIPLSMQVKLLRLLETGTFRRLGSTELRTTDIRLISATHQPLAAMVRDGRFRQDLYYRVNTFPIRVPPLRERTGDIPLLTAALLKRIVPEKPPTVTPDAMALLEAYHYPGNVRELRNILERAVLLSNGQTIRAEDLPDEVRFRSTEAHVPQTSQGIGHESDALDDAQLRRLAETFPGPRRALAAHLGISERTLYRRLAALGIARRKPGKK